MSNFDNLDPRLAPPAETEANPTGQAASEPELLVRERAVLRKILALVAERAELEAKVHGDLVSGDSRADTEYAKARQALGEKLARLESEANAEDEKQRLSIVKAAMAGESKAKAEFGAASRKIATLFDAARDTANGDLVTGRSQAGSTHDSAQKKAAKQNAEKSKPIEDSAGLADSIRNRLAFLAGEYKKFGLDPDPAAPVSESYEKFSDPSDELFTRLARMDPPLRLLEGLIIPKSMKGGREAWVFILLISLFAGAGMLIEGGVTGLVVGVVLGGVLAFLLRTWLVKLCKVQLERLYTPLTQSLADADALTAYCRVKVAAEFKEERKRIATRREEDLKQVDINFHRAFAAAEARRDEKLRKINEVYAEQMVEVQTTRERDMRSALDAHDRRMAELRAMTETGYPKLDGKYKAYKERIRSKHETEWNTLASRWREGVNQAAAELDAVNHEVDAYCPDWNDPAWQSRSLPKLVPPVIRFGKTPLDLASLPGGTSRHADLMEGVPRSFAFPALRTFPTHANLLIETPAEARAAALEVLQASMFRLLTSLPPGQVRFTIIDPIGIGRNFGAFMHLADYDAALVTNQVWTDPRQIEERLADLAVHMETVTQKYLRNEYATIEEYNAVAEEVAEPYRVLVVADFPSKFDEKSAARLAAIASGGIPCGVLTLVAVDTSKPLPPGFGLDELRPHCAALNWDAAVARLVWDDRDFGRYPLSLDPPPPAEFSTRQIQKVGAAAQGRQARRSAIRVHQPPRRRLLDARQPQWN